MNFCLSDGAGSLEKHACIAWNVRLKIYLANRIRINLLNGCPHVDERIILNMFYVHIMTTAVFVFCFFGSPPHENGNVWLTLSLIAIVTIPL